MKNIKISKEEAELLKEILEKYKNEEYETAQNSPATDDASEWEGVREINGILRKINEAFPEE